MQVEVAGGVHHVGQGIELRVGVVARGQRPELDPPAIAGADVWLIRNELKPLSVSGIGSMTVEANAFVSRFRVVPRRAGTLEVPSIRARLKDRTGRSRPVRADVRPVPPEGRPRYFLGGVGPFALQAEARPRSVRVGQELEYRITVTGPAAWGTTGRPELDRFDRLPIGLRIEPRPAEVVHEPPSRTFVYKLRPTRPGEAVLPPVSFSAFDPSTSRYVTRVTPSVPIKSVAVPSFDPATIPDLNAEARAEGGPMGRAAVGDSHRPGRPAAGLGRRDLLGERRARKSGQLGGPAAARRYAARIASGLGRPGSSDAKDLLPVSTWGPRAERPGPDAPAFDLALEISSALIRYLQIGLGRPPGALTPAEAGEGIVHVHRVGRARRPGRPDRIPVRRRPVSRRARDAGRPRPVPAGRPGPVRSPGRVVVGWA